MFENLGDADIFRTAEKQAASVIGSAFFPPPAIRGLVSEQLTPSNLYYTQQCTLIKAPAMPKSYIIHFQHFEYLA